MKLFVWTAVLMAAVAAAEPLEIAGDPVALDSGGALLTAHLEKDTLVVQRIDMATHEAVRIFEHDRKSAVEEGIPLPGIEAALSPEGRRLAFVDNEGLKIVELRSKVERLVLTPAATEEAVEDEDSTGAEEAPEADIEAIDEYDMEMDYRALTSPSWAPDGRTIAVNVMMFEANQWGLVDLVTSAWTPLEVKTEWSDHDMVNGWELDWSGDSLQIVVASSDLMNGQGLYVSIEGAPSKMVDLSPGIEGDETLYLDAEFAPDGNRIALAFANIDDTVSGIGMLTKADNALPVKRSTGLIQHLRFSEDGKRLYYWRQAAENGYPEGPLTWCVCDTGTLAEKVLAEVPWSGDNFDTYDVDESTRVTEVFSAEKGWGAAIQNPVGETGATRIVLLDPATGALVYRSEPLSGTTMGLGVTR